MDDRVTIRLTEPLRKSLTAYCNSTGRTQSDALRYILEKGLDKVRTRYTWSEERRDLAKLLRPVLDHFESVSRELLDKTAKRIEDELHIALAGVRDDLSPLAEAQKSLLESITELERLIAETPKVDPMLAMTISEIRGFANGIFDAMKAGIEGKLAKDATVIETGRNAGKRFGVEVFQPPKTGG